MALTLSARRSPAGVPTPQTRFGADVVLDLLGGEETERTTSRMVRETPLPFPPEPLRWAGITATRHSLAAADREGGRRNLWLRGLDRAGLGFDSEAPACHRCSGRDGRPYAPPDQPIGRSADR